MSSTHILAFAGSIRNHSVNKALIEISQKLAPEGMIIEHFDLKDIPLYNMDLEGDIPAAVQEFKKKLAAADGVLIAVPEHNYSFSGVLKNAIDWASRPYGQNSLAGKPVALQSAAMSFAGGVRGQLHFRQVLGYLQAKQLYFPEVFVGSSHTKFDDNGNLNDDFAKEAIKQQLVAFQEFVLANK